MSANVKNLIDKITDKDAQVLKAYNNGTQSSRFAFIQETRAKIRNL
jgi:hypothetical protein